MQQNIRRSLFFPDETPVARWYQLYALALLGYVRQHVPSREDAEDIVIEVFIAALEQKGSSLLALNEQEHLAWLRRVAYHKCIDLHRRSTRRPAVPLEEAEQTLFEDELLGPERVALSHEDKKVLHQRLSQLPEHYQTILQFRFAHGLRCAEISGLLNKSEGAIRVLLSRALNSLRDIYIEEQEEKRNETR
jgi:RNA polymerase sigma factor (sigma-70 family)